ncbi:ABC transporter ATP-binding protein [Arhodomonas sp. AD133]|uniref:ABC transporter ATP-binding protein n=1 Tax=Arhodomonas sp. AD133 TaxID=3415009 RepID=UPI003EBB6D35
MSLLHLHGLTKRFGEFAAVDAFELEVSQGEFVSLLGPSGCGKTTTLQMIAGFLDPSAGRIVMDGRDLTTVKANHRGIGIVFQSYALFPHMTVTENVAFGLEMRRVPRGERTGRVHDALELVRLNGLGERYPRELSGGQRQRVALARALVIRPPLLLLDEPLSNLDAKLREEMQLELRSIQQRVGTTTIMVTHDQGEALSMSDRVVVMNRGRIVQVDEPFHAYERPSSAFVSRFVGKTNLLAARHPERVNGVPRVCVGDSEIELPGVELPSSHDFHISIRPERVELTDPGEGALQATVRTRLFLGDHWLYQLDSPVGELLATRPNRGGSGVRVGEQVGVRWSAEGVRVVTEEHGDD